MRALWVVPLATLLLAIGCGDDDEGRTVPVSELPPALESVADSLKGAGIEFESEVLDALGKEDRVGLIVNPGSESAVVIRDGDLTTQVRVDDVAPKVSFGCKGYIAEAENGVDIKQVLDEAGLCPELRS